MKAPPRLVALGDLNGAYDVLVDVLRSTGLIDRALAWRGGRAELVQVGDLFNRGGGASQALRLLLKLQPQARRAGGRVTVLLGNHEVMTALGHEGYCTEEEYLSFAAAAERRRWPARVERAFRRLLRQRDRGVVLPIKPRLEAWKIEHVPGRVELRRALSAHGALGRALRRLPVAYVSSGAVFVHAGLLPVWARLGLSGLQAQADACWTARKLWKLPKSSLFRAGDGPLWDRSLVAGGKLAAAQLRESLRLLGVRRMVVGHTQTAALPRGEAGRILVLERGQLIGVDVGLTSGDGTPRAALIIEGARGFEWTPQGTRLLWHDR